MFQLKTPLKTLRRFNWKLLFTLFAFGFIFTACDDDDDVTPELENEEEEITTVKLTFVDDSGTNPNVVVFWKDLDGDGGNPPVIDPITIVDGTAYTLSVEFLNENETPVEDVTEEVEEEDDEHQVFFTGAAVGSLISVAYDDSDDDGNPIGLDNDVSILQAGGPSVFTVILRHEPDKNATGVAQGDITNAGGETDVEVNFDLTVQ